MTYDMRLHMRQLDSLKSAVRYLRTENAHLKRKDALQGFDLAVVPGLKLEPTQEDSKKTEQAKDLLKSVALETKVLVKVCLLDFIPFLSISPFLPRDGQNFVQLWGILILTLCTFDSLGYPIHQRLTKGRQSDQARDWPVADAEAHAGLSVPGAAGCTVHATETDPRAQGEDSAAWDIEYCRGKLYKGKYMLPLELCFCF